MYTLPDAECFGAGLQFRFQNSGPGKKQLRIGFEICKGFEQDICPFIINQSAGEQNLFG